MLLRFDIFLIIIAKNMNICYINLYYKYDKSKGY